ncbi:MAG: hypothetical protein ACRCWM_10650 [Sarcina sp.]
MKKEVIIDKMKHLLRIGASIIFMYFILTIIEGDIFTGGYIKEFDEPEIGGFSSYSPEDYKGRVVRVDAIVIDKIDKDKEEYVMRVADYLSEDTVMVVRNNTDFEFEKGDIVEINGFYAGRKKVGLSNGFLEKVPIVDTFIATEVDYDEYEGSREMRNNEMDLNIKEERDENTELLVGINFIDKFKNYNLINFGVIKPGEDTYIIKNLKVESYIGDKLIEKENIKLLNYEITEKKHFHFKAIARCGLEVTKAKIIIEYTTKGEDTVKTNTTEVEIPKKKL